MGILQGIQGLNKDQITYWKMEATISGLGL